MSVLPSVASGARAWVGHVTNAMRVASPALLDACRLLRRVDSKFVVPVDLLPSLLGDISAHYGVVRAGERSLATYDTLYFDTPELRCFHDHRRGRRARHKLRIRHYPDRALTYLEVKTKLSQEVTRKHRRPIAFGAESLMADDLAFVAEHCDLPPAAVVPRLRTEFRRLSLVGLYIEERVTIDLDLRFECSDASGPAQELGEVAIIEVKQPRFNLRSPLVRGLRGAGRRPASASKYCVGTALTRPGLRLNRLLPSIRHIERIRS